MQRRKLILSAVLVAAACGTASDSSSSEAGSTPTTGSEPQSVAAGEAELSVALSDEVGLTSFRDSGTGEVVNVYIRDADTDNPVNDLTVSYFDGNGFEVFLALDEEGEYAPAIGFYEHNSDHVLKVVKYWDSEYTVTRLDEWGDPLDAPSDVSRIVQEWTSDAELIERRTYIETITTAEFDEGLRRTEADFIALVVARLGAAAVTGSPISAAKVLSDLVWGDLVPDREGPLWDVYRKEWPVPSISGSGFENGVWLYIESQPPRIENLKVTTSDQTVTASWSGADELIYWDSGVEDATVFLGPTSGPDLSYSYRLISETGLGPWTTTQTEWVEFADLEPDTYIIEVYATDEVGNQSVVEDSTFKVDGPPTQCPDVNAPVRFEASPQLSLASYLNHDASGSQNSRFATSIRSPSGNCDHEWNYVQVIQDEAAAQAAVVEAAEAGGYQCAWHDHDALQRYHCIRGSEYLTLDVIGQIELNVLWQIPRTNDANPPPATTTTTEGSTSVCADILLPTPPVDIGLTFDGSEVNDNPMEGACSHNWYYVWEVDTGFALGLDVRDQIEDVYGYGCDQSFGDATDYFTCYRGEEILNVSVWYDCPDAPACVRYWVIEQYS